MPSRVSSTSEEVSWQLISTADGRSFVQTVGAEGEPGYRVDIVCDANGSRELAGRFADRREAEELADWFGRTGPVRAEVTRG